MDQISTITTSENVTKIACQHKSSRSKHGIGDRCLCCQDFDDTDTSENRDISRLSDSSQIGSSKFLVFLFLLHGIGALLPWNMLIDAVDYFEFKINQSEYHQDFSLLTNNNILDIKENMFSYISIASKAPNILLQALNIWFTLMSASSPNNQSDLNRNGVFNLSFIKCSLTTRIQLSLIIQIFIFITLIIFDHQDTNDWSANTVFAFIIICTIGLNMANGIYQSCIYGVAARIPQLKFTNAITIGMSLSGTITSLLDIGSIAISPSPQIEIIVFFSVAALILFLCLCCEFYYVNHFGVQRKNLLCITVIDDDLMNQSLIDEENRSSETNHDQHECSRPSKWQLYIYTINDIWPHLVNILLIYIATFSLFPAVVANIHPGREQKGQQKLFNISYKYFTPVFCFFTLNFFTSIGNLLAERYPLGNWPKRIGLLSLARFGMVPFFLYCNYLPPTAHRTHMAVWIQQDWLFLAGVIVLALSAGYLSSLSMMYAPKSVRRRTDTSQREEQLRVEAAGMISALTIIIGILAGANSSLIYPQLI